MSEMVERVARALFNSEQEAFPVRVRRKPFDDIDEVSGVAARYRFLARAAIAAMRGPTPEMLDLLADSYGGCIHDFESTWRQAIEIILGAKDPIWAAIQNKSAWKGRVA